MVEYKRKVRETRKKLAEEVHAKQTIFKAKKVERTQERLKAAHLIFMRQAEEHNTVERTKKRRENLLSSSVDSEMVQRRRERFKKELENFFQDKLEPFKMDWKLFSRPEVGRANETARQEIRRKLSMPLLSAEEIEKIQADDAREAQAYRAEFVKPPMTAEELQKAKVVRMQRAVARIRLIKEEKQTRLEKNISALTDQIMTSWRSDLKQLEEIVPVNAPFLGVLPKHHAPSALSFVGEFFFPAFLIYQFLFCASREE